MSSVSGTQNPTSTKGVKIAEPKKKSAKPGKALTVNVIAGMAAAGQCYGYNGATNPPDVSELENGVVRLQSTEGNDSGLGLMIDQDVSSYTHLEFKIRATIKDLRSTHSRDESNTRLVVQLFPKGDGGFIEMGMWRSAKALTHNTDNGGQAADVNGIVLNALYNPADVESKEWITVRVPLFGYPNNNLRKGQTRLNSCSKIQLQVNGVATSDVQIKDLRFVCVAGSSVPVGATVSADSSAPVMPESPMPKIEQVPAGKNIDDFPTIAQSTFNGAAGGIENGILELSGRGIDSGFTMVFEKSINGKLCVKLLRGTVDISFIKAVSPTQWQEDERLNIESVSDSSGYVEIKIPSGTNKINFNIRESDIKAEVKIKE